MNPKSELLIIHESGAKSHYLALEKNHTITYYEFALLKPILKGVIRKDWKLIGKQYVNARFLLFALCAMQNREVILGISPFDFRILFFLRMTRKNKVTYHTSWYDWCGDSYPKRFFPSLVKPAWRRFLALTNKVACVTAVGAEEVLRFSNIDKAKIRIVGHSLPDEYFTIPQNDSSKENIVLFVGRWNSQKGIDIVQRLSKKLEGTARLVIVGEDIFGGRPPKLKNATIMGYLKDKKELIKLYDSAKFLVQPSRRSRRWQELFGISILEAMSRGCVAICTNHVGPLSTISHNKNGFIFEEGEYENKAAETILNLIKDNDQRVKISEAAKNKAREFTAEQISKHWE
jgi:glycosyltransferase involved in cell wall biosynthesis